jgi:hypothetical protein
MCGPTDLTQSPACGGKHSVIEPAPVLDFQVLKVLGSGLGICEEKGQCYKSFMSSRDYSPQFNAVFHFP